MINRLNMWFIKFLKNGKEKNKEEKGQEVLL